MSPVPRAASSSPFKSRSARRSRAARERTSRAESDDVHTIRARSASMSPSRADATSPTASSPRSAGARSRPPRRNAIAMTFRVSFRSPRSSPLGYGSASSACSTARTSTSPADGSTSPCAQGPRTADRRCGHQDRGRGSHHPDAARGLRPALEDEAEFDSCAPVPMFADTQQQHNTIDNIHPAPSCEASDGSSTANKLLAAFRQPRDHALHAAWPPTHLRLDPAQRSTCLPARAMFLLGHTDPSAHDTRL